MENWKKENTLESTFEVENHQPGPNELLAKFLSSRAYSGINSKMPSKPKVLEVGIFAGDNALMLTQILRLKISIL